MNVNEMRLGFEMKTKELSLELILPIRKIKSPHNLRRYQAIVKSIREVGMIEPLVVHPQKDKSGTFLLLDGHLRIFALKQLGKIVAECIISNDDECFTYNARINRLPPIQCHKMIVKAIRNGVNPERLATALDMPLNVISEKAIRLLKKVKPLRQIEIAELLVSANNYSLGYVEALILGTPSDQRMNPAEPKKKTGLSAEELAGMEREMESLEKDFKAVKASFTENMMCLTCARGYIKKLLNNAKVVRFLNANFSDIISGFEGIVAAEAL
ncbi:MAG: chromosome partitioning protein ParB [Verrucomicrobia bacterium]|nr:MAG: chromosome partitioning protein ParB [Verrucomicrobiota bacterium]